MSYLSPQRRNTKISERNNEEKQPCSTFVKSTSCWFCCFHHGIEVSFFYLRNWVLHSGYSSSERCCVALFHLTCPIVQHQVVLQRHFDVEGLLWVECKSRQWHEPGERLHHLTGCQASPCNALSVLLRGKGSLQLHFIRLTNSMIVFGDLKTLN